MVPDPGGGEGWGAEARSPESLGMVPSDTVLYPARNLVSGDI